MKNQHDLATYGWLHKHLEDPNLVIGDCRFALGNPTQGLAGYRSGHIPRALDFDLEKDLSGPVGKHGGRHPLPKLEALVSLFSRMGIDEKITVIAYDDSDMAMAARLWWLLRYLGHERVAVLDGGFQAWRAQNLPVTREVRAPQVRLFVPRVQSQMLVDIEQVKACSPKTVLLDSRAGERYRGEVEPFDPKAGHIPGAQNYHYKENLNADGTMCTPDELRKRFAALEKKREIVAYCGSGVTACVNVLALYQAGRTDAKLYAGSWSDWCSYDLPIELGMAP